MLSPLSRSVPRLAFLVRSFLLGSLSFVAIGVIVFLDRGITEDGWTAISYIWAIAFLLAWVFYAVAPRCRDLGLSGWYAFGIFVPVLGVLSIPFLFLMKSKTEETGEARPNQPPLPTPGKCPPSNHHQLPGAADL